MPSRLAKNRVKKEGEPSKNTKSLRKVRRMTCKLCYKEGHNKTACLNKDILHLRPKKAIISSFYALFTCFIFHKYNIYILVNLF